MAKLNLKKLLLPLAFIAVVGIAFAFKVSKDDAKPVKTKPVELVWLKYKCDVPNEIEDRGTTNIFTDVSSLCPAPSGTLCAEQYNMEDLVETSSPGFYEPVEDAVPISSVYCP